MDPDGNVMFQNQMTKEMAKDRTWLWTGRPDSGLHSSGNRRRGELVLLVTGFPNMDFQAHGFQVTYYYDSNIVTIVPDEILHVSFVADKTGEFRIYCNIFCSIHWAMQSGLLNVTSA